ncbi:XRE family transcriptional regulator [uncultured Sporomusa sp.]|uniref:XRE family transcriptional regulator n=1 Tax=uncultured Sporomusa sp. TaxID=307249 RepID=A0A212LTM1_9FIRM|nr:helix-turn-helix transcriptional regulator [uncultured Sporomusa sp.]SCM80846.1 XRE family transcriptional regulator [uncultured Sporomusa sp.]
MQNPSNSEDIQEIVHRLKEIRKNSGLSQANFAKKIGVSQGNVGTWETGGSLPGALALKSIAQIFDCSIDWILTGTEKTTPTQKIETLFDPDLKEMLDIVKRVMDTDDQEQRIWAKVQLKRAFAEFSATEAIR